MNFQKYNFQNLDRAFLSKTLSMYSLLADEIFRFDILALVAYSVVITGDSLLVIIRHSLLVIFDRSMIMEYQECLNLLTLFGYYYFCCYSEMITFMG